MTEPSADALVLFGATGDLARKKIYPALQRMARRGQIEMPVIGVASSPLGRDALRERVYDSLKQQDGVDEEAFVRGQYAGYRGENGVRPESQVETFAAVALYLDSWRWQGVPFHIRAGKCPPLTATEVLVEWRHPPQKVFDEPLPERPNYVRFRLGPDTVGWRGSGVAGHRSCSWRSNASPHV